ncbi:hypothetical protein E8E11_006796 [Didymella keratinophila]|nr:hypothetical protein E8E11_006796 [Didymella keratinophila]
MHLDGASDSKPALETVHEHHSIPSLERKPSKLRRFMSISSRDRKSLNRLNLPTNAGTTPPLQTLSPRPTEFEPGAKKHTKRSISSYLLPRTPASEHQPANANNNNNNNVNASVQGHVPVTETAELSLPAVPGKEDEDRLGNHGHLPVICGNPSLSKHEQARKDSATKSFYDMPLPASRTAALTSHPVGKEDLESEGFRTPRELDGAWKGDDVEK